MRVQRHTVRTFESFWTFGATERLLLSCVGSRQPFERACGAGFVTSDSLTLRSVIQKPWLLATREV